jgi:hypothetical protein
VCRLCNINDEDANHLLIHCSFTKAVWQLHLSKIYHLKILWAGSSVSDFLNVWTFEKSAPVSLAAIACWHIWIERNKVLFENITPSYRAVVHRIVVSFSWQPTNVIPIPNRVCDFTHIEGFTLACFDGEALSSGDFYEAGVFFKTHASRVTKWYINCGAGTNTKAELMGMWVTLTLASLWAIDKIQILGDSKVIID